MPWRSILRRRLLGTSIPRNGPAAIRQSVGWADDEPRGISHIRGESTDRKIIGDRSRLVIRGSRPGACGLCGANMGTSLSPDSREGNQSLYATSGSLRGRYSKLISGERQGNQVSSFQLPAHGMRRRPSLARQKSRSSLLRSNKIGWATDPRTDQFNGACNRPARGAILWL